MTLVVNGRSREVAEDTTLQDLVPVRTGKIARGIAIARNGEVVPKSQWSAVQVRTGDRIEILNAIGGG